MSQSGTADVPYKLNALEFRFAGLRVLLVDPHPDSLYLCTTVLESCDINVMPVMSAEQALQCLPQFRPQLVITELLLPGKNGCFLVHQLRTVASDSSLTIPAIALTTQVSERDRQQTAIAGFAKHIAKPYLIEELIAAIAELVSTKSRSVRP